jgi:hypothetical protein
MAAESSFKNHPVMTRDEMLAAGLPYEVRRMSIAPDGTQTVAIYRYASEEGARTYLEEERRVLNNR